MTEAEARLALAAELDAAPRGEGLASSTRPPAALRARPPAGHQRRGEEDMDIPVEKVNEREREEPDQRR